MLFFQLIASCFNYTSSRIFPFVHDKLIPEAESLVYESLNVLKKCINILIIFKYISVLVSTRIYVKLACIIIRKSSPFIPCTRDKMHCINKW